ncbi:glycerophosphodiester phosphodiesterase [Streptomyces iconiensis]|uniref:Glycerophosphodiester phosphodiesterase family protein n=1 Tax=Streptomyces iconiensis TaxID=1384038 RepID=A0ABT6ZXE5_9ACTN|nr:glycerophosphodiester phosphodiesterase family protein [Streptomyces iconiensis]MDJ1133479.1 glycerophosphodiester phosphodiesterase family protein [Streptomyces iconiensis]
MVTKTVLVSLVSLALGTAPANASPVPAAANASPVPASASHTDRPSRVVYIAHRGGALEVPENSMQGLTATHRRGHASLLDIDVRVLRDGTLVAMHDATLDRTTNRKGPVKALDRKGWEKVRLVPPAGLPGNWRRERPPTVPEILDRFGGRAGLVLELKDPAGLPHLARTLRERKLTRSVYVQTNRLRLAVTSHKMGLRTAVWRSARQMRLDRPERWKRNVDVLSVDHRAHPRHARRAVASGIRHVWSHTVNTPSDRDRMLRLGCAGIVTDVPSRLAARSSSRAPLAR